MKKLFFLAVCLAFAAIIPVRAQSDEYREALTRVMELIGILETAEQGVARVSAEMAPAELTSIKQEALKKFAIKFTERFNARMVDIYMPVYSKFLTLEDLKYLTEVYNSPVMRKLHEANLKIDMSVVADLMVASKEMADEIGQELEDEGFDIQN